MKVTVKKINGITVINGLTFAQTFKKVLTPLGYTGYSEITWEIKKTVPKKIKKVLKRLTLKV